MKNGPISPTGHWQFQGASSGHPLNYGYRPRLQRYNVCCCVPLNYWFLAVPTRNARWTRSSCPRKLRGSLGPMSSSRPSLLTGGASAYHKLRAGYSSRKSAEKDDGWNKTDGIAIGYIVATADVGTFIFQELIQKASEATCHI